MEQPLPSTVPSSSAPSFYITGRQRLGPGALLVATFAAAAVLSSVMYGLGHNARGHWPTGRPTRSASSSAAASPADDKDDPNQIDTIVLGDPADPPAPARTNNHVSPVHPTILVRLPRYGNDVGLIPNTPTGHLLYDWLAAFNQANSAALANVLPTAAPSSTDAQMELRKETGGFNLVSAKEVQPGLLVFRVRDQTPSGTEALGALQMVPGSNPASIATFSLGSVPSSR